MENVAALLNRGMGRVLADLARIRYDAEWSIVSACSMGAPHMRRRVFIVAYPNGGIRWAGFRDFANREDALSEINRFESARVSYAKRMANASQLYRDVDGVPFGLDRGRAVGNAVAPDVAQWIGERINAALDS
jgi:DNA (cytosine-5)-methyltransferase 1